MKYVLKHILLIMSTFACILVFPNCRGEIIPTEGDLASYGWVLYEGSDFDNARVWFGDAMRKDSTYIDSYNGMGWTMGHLRQPDSALHYFEKYILDVNPNSFTEEWLDIYAGLSFAYNAMGNDDKTREYCLQFFDINNQNLILEEGWVFSHNGEFDYFDVFVIKALSEFNLARWDDCETTINRIHDDPDAPNFPPFECEQHKNNSQGDYIGFDTTAVGREDMAYHIELLQVSLAE